MLGIGADYPLSAVICSEFAPRKHRARMLASVFFCQPLGQLLGMIVSLVVVTVSRNSLMTEGKICTTNDCIRTLDSAWRWIVGFGSLPAVVALFFRLSIPESPRYLLDVVGAVKSAALDTQDYYKGDAFGQSQELMEDGLQSQGSVTAVHQIPKSSRPGTTSPSSNLTPANEGHEGIAAVHSPGLGAQPFLDPLPSPNIARSDDEISHSRARALDFLNSPAPSIRSTEQTPNEQQPPNASWQDAYQYFIVERNWINLFTTSSSWLFLDVSFLPYLEVNQS